VKLIVGLGNPGLPYEATRHNIGFRVIDALGEVHRLGRGCRLPTAEYRAGVIAAESVILAKPLTYMNSSGKAVADLCMHFSLTPSDLIVVHDDLDLPLGHIRLKIQGGDAGHYGVRSIIKHLNTHVFTRIRVGIGRPASKEEVVAFVLSPFSADELPLVAEAVRGAVEYIEHLLKSPEGVMGRDVHP
jgi:peptidyl-tRNA hydrolase, PTH1 family